MTDDDARALSAPDSGDPTAARPSEEARAFLARHMNLRVFPHKDDLLRALDAFAAVERERERLRCLRWVEQGRPDNILRTLEGIRQGREAP